MSDTNFKTIKVYTTDNNTHTHTKVCGVEYKQDRIQVYKEWAEVIAVYWHPHVALVKISPYKEA